MSQNVNIFVENISQGCENFPKGSYDYLWCKKAETDIKKGRMLENVKKSWKEFLTNYASEFSSGLRAVKYSKDLPFFVGRRQDAIEAMNAFKKQCESLANYMFNQMVEFSKSYVVLDNKDQYHPINRLNTHYTAVAFLMTTFLGTEQKKLETKDALDYFLNSKNKNGLSPFELILDKIFADKILGDFRFRFENTLESTWIGGSKIESNFIEYLTNSQNNIEVKVYAGEYSFVDMMGMDMIIVSPSGKWIPVQVKKNVNDCSTPFRYQKNMCENWCVSSVGNSWDIKVYQGDRKVIDNSQCKSKPLNEGFFLDNGIDSDNESFEQSKC